MALCNASMVDEGINACGTMDNTGNTVSLSKAPCSDEMKELLEVLHGVIACMGREFGPVRFHSDRDLSLIRQTAACCIIEFFKVNAVTKTMTTDDWHQVGWMLLDPDDNTRRATANALFTVIQTHPVHLKILAYPCLLASDDELCGQAENALTFAVKRLRCTYEFLCAQAISKNDDRLRRLAEDQMAECILPYVLNLLSHHPDFPTSSTLEAEGDKNRVKTIVKSVRMVLAALSSTLRDEADNLSYLLKQVSMIIQNYRDKLDPDNIGLLFVTRITRNLLKEKIRTSEHVQPYDGDINLPMDIYDFSIDGEINQQMEGLDYVEGVIEKALHAAGKGTAKRSHGERKERPAKQDTSNSIYDESKAKSAKSMKEKSVKAAPAATITEYLSNRPKRATRNEAVDYKEKVESEREMNLWEQTAAEKARQTRGTETRNETKNSSFTEKDDDYHDDMSPLKIDTGKSFAFLNNRQSQQPTGILSRANVDALKKSILQKAFSGKL